MSRIHLSAPDVRPLEREMLLAALDSGWVAPVGPDLDAFEAELAARCGVGHAVGLASGTAALHLALLLAGVQPGDDVIVPTMTFAATANAVTYCGARPCFVDSERATWNLSPQLLSDELATRSRTGAAPAAVITVDLYGQCADYDAITAMCAEHGVPVIEDAAEALGATWQGRPAGSFGRCAVLSFNGNKLITTSGGGALLCDDEQSAARARYLATQARQPAPHYEHTEVGFNYRLSNLLAAFGRGQLATIDERIARRHQIGARYAALFDTVAGIEMSPTDPRGTTNGWLSCITVDPSRAPVTAEQVRAHLEGHDIEARPLWKPMHAQPAFAGNPARLDGTSDALFATGLCLPSGSGMVDADVDRVLGALEEVLLVAG
jgi:pyridoxal phosphate-dependent aminotransferase EpsN